jgi:hypothetical protein
MLSRSCHSAFQQTAKFSGALQPNGLLWQPQKTAVGRGLPAIATDKDNMFSKTDNFRAGSVHLSEWRSFAVSLLYLTTYTLAGQNAFPCRWPWHSLQPPYVIGIVPVNLEDGGDMFFRSVKQHNTLHRAKPLPFHRFCLNVRPHFYVTLGSKFLSYETLCGNFSDRPMTRLLPSVSHATQTRWLWKLLAVRSSAFHQLFTPKWLRCSLFSITRARPGKGRFQSADDADARVHSCRHSKLGEQRALRRPGSDM